MVANLLPVGLIFYFVHRFGVDLPWQDEWEFVKTLQQFQAGTLGFTALMTQLNEHRMPFPRLLTVANAMLFHWDRTVEMYVTATLLILCVWLLFRFVRTFWDHPLTLLFFLPIAWTLLSWRQWENLLMGMGTVFGLLVTGATVAFLLLHRTRSIDRFVMGAAAAAFVASFSSGGGLLIWPVGLAQLSLQRAYGTDDEKPDRSAFVIWAGAAALAYVLFFVGYQERRVTWPTGLAYMAQHPVDSLRFMASVIGSPLSVHQAMAQSFGIILTVIAAWAVLRIRKAPAELVAAAPLLAFMVLTLLTVAMTCDRRMGRFGLIAALQSRYCSLTGVGLVALYALLVRFTFKEGHQVTVLACGAVGAFLTLGAMTNYASWSEDPRRSNGYELGVYAVRSADVVSDEALLSVLGRPNVARERIPFLREHGYSLFHQAVPMGVPVLYRGASAGCYIDSVNGRQGPLVSVSLRGDSSGLRVSGWAVDAAVGQTASRVFVSIDDRIDVPTLPQDRPDVAVFFKNPNYARCGFLSYVRTSLLTPGEHTLRLKIVSHDGASYSTCGALQLRASE